MVIFTERYRQLYIHITSYLHHDQLRYQVALSLLDGVGPITAKSLVAYCGGVQAIFEDPDVSKVLKKTPRAGQKVLKAIQDPKLFHRVDKELVFLDKRGIKAVFYLNDDYPLRLKQCEDSPTLFYMDGNAELNNPKVLSVVGTRKATDHGRKVCERIIEELAPHGPLIVSGLAYGIDICAHRSALKNGLPTVAAVAHGLDRLYPGEHAATAREMVENGGLITDKESSAKFVPGNFPSRNRIIAGLADATLVVESAKGGGSMITADIANSYSREVLAVPGRPYDKYSEGCNNLVKANMAAMVTNGQEIAKHLGWKQESAQPVDQTRLWAELPVEQQTLVDIIKEKGQAEIDQLSIKAGIPTGKAASLLLEMEFSGVVRSLPGKVYTLN